VIAPPPLTLTCASSTGQVGVLYSSALTASGGVPPYTFSITSGSLPPGLTLNTSTGAITGTPTTAGTFNFTAKVTDSSGNSTTGTVSTNCSIVIAPPTTNICGLTWGYWKNHVSAWPVTSLVLGSQTYNQAQLINLLGLPVAGDASINLAHQLIAAKFNVLNGTNPATDGGAIAAADSILSTFSGYLPYNVDSSSTVGTQMTTIAGQLDTFNSDGAAQPGCTNGPAPLTLACAGGTGQVGVPYSSAFVASGGVAPYTFSIVSGSLPPGLTLNTSTGAVTGTPTAAGTFSFTVQVSDSTAIPGSNVGTTQINCSITIQPAPVSANCVTINAVQGTPITPVTMIATGGTGTGYTFSATGLPSGVTMSSSGTISGTPTVSGTFNYTVTVKDSAGDIGTVHCSVTVSKSGTPPLVLTCATSTGQVGSPYSSALVASGGVPPYTSYAITSGSLPPGLTLNTSTGAITGTPTTAGTFSFNATVVDSRGATAGTATASCSITIGKTSQPLCKGDTATIGFWHNKNGQALIKSLNGGANSTALATWLTTNFPNLYGSYNLKTNTDVANLFLTFFGVSGAKTNAQILAGALAAYVTDSGLAGTVAASYGFNVSSSGTGAKTYNTGSDGTAIGLLNNTSYTIMQLLQQANKIAPFNSTEANALNDIFDGINQTGDIN
jgi:hypothetical protein